MNMNQLVNMIMRIVLRRVVNKGIDAGVNRVGGKRKRKGPQKQPPLE